LERNSGVTHFDGAHTHGCGWLQVDAEIIEKDALIGRDTNEFACNLVKAWLRFATPDFAAFDNMVELGQDGGYFDVARRGVRGGRHDIVREASRAVAGLDDEVEGAHHEGANISREESKDIGSRYAMAKSGALCGEELIELGRSDVIALEEGPGVRIGVCGVHTTNMVEREPTAGFIAIKGLKGA